MGFHLIVACLLALGPGDEAARTGPETEKRFPPLTVPPGFKATLFACDPLIEYPSVLALGPRRGTVFLAHDYMTGLGTEIVRRDEVRLLEDKDGDGYADASTVYASGFNSIQGLEYHEGRVFVMHAPFLTSCRDSDGDGVADERRDLLNGLGWRPEDAPDRLHCANGIAAGHDGWLYLALGDRGCNVVRPEGDRLVLNGGGILRVRPDGSDLHVFSTGHRNIYDVALDEELNVFVRDNENDGGTYMIRVYHSFFGADHGYPYLYQEHPGEGLAPLADLGRGSSAGGLCYREPAFPPPYRGSLFFCEWGRSVVRYHRERAGGTFARMTEVEFAAGAPGDPYGFKPTDLIVDRDGSLLVTDWGDDQRPKRGRGRLYRIRFDGEQERAREGLDAESYFARIEAQAALERRGPAEVKSLRKRWAEIGVLGRLHAVWAIARAGEDPIGTLFEIAETDPDARVCAQAVRAIADLVDPVLARHRLDAGGGDPVAARRLAALGRKADARVLLEVTVALGRLGWNGAPSWLRENLSVSCPALAHAAAQTLRRARAWNQALDWLDAAADDPVRSIALRAAAEQADVEVVDGLLRRLDVSTEPGRRREYAELLSRVHRKPGAWVYWGFRPGPRPANTEAWERTRAIEAGLDNLLMDPDRGVRRAVLAYLSREKVPVRPETLVRWLAEEADPDGVAALLASLKEAPAEKARPAFEGVIRGRSHATPNRLLALDAFVRGLDKASEPRLLEAAASLEDSPVLAECLRQLGKRPKLESRSLLREKLGSQEKDVQIAAVESLAELKAIEAAPAFAALLEHREAPVRARAAEALGKLGAREGLERMLGLAGDPDAAVRAKALEALGRLGERRAVPLAVSALEDEAEVQTAALSCLVETGGPEQADAVAALARRSRSLEVLQGAVRALGKWRQGRAAAEVQGESGILIAWTFSGPLAGEDAAATLEAIGLPGHAPPEGWRDLLADGRDSRVRPGQAGEGSVWMGFADFAAAEPFRAQFLASSNGMLRAWVNGRAAHHRPRAGAFAPDSDRFEADLQEGLNRIVVEVSAPGPAEVHARFRRKSSVERHEKLAQLALTTTGKPDRGREVFFNAEKTGCIKCHRLGDQGGRVGPDLTGAGRRFSRIHLVESILEPSRVIAPAYRNIAVQMKDGLLIFGVKVAETDATLTLGDSQGQSHMLEKDQIKGEHPLETSVMPEGIEKVLTDSEFGDLIGFLADQK